VVVRPCQSQFPGRPPVPLNVRVRRFRPPPGRRRFDGGRWCPRRVREPARDAAGLVVPCPSRGRGRGRRHAGRPAVPATRRCRPRQRRGRAVASRSLFPSRTRRTVRTRLAMSNCYARSTAASRATGSDPPTRSFRGETGALWPPGQRLIDRTSRASGPLEVAALAPASSRAREAGPSPRGRRDRHGDRGPGRFPTGPGAPDQREVPHPGRPHRGGVDRSSAWPMAALNSSSRRPMALPRLAESASIRSSRRDWSSTVSLIVPDQ
jgi:hypothetical protein